MNFLFYLKTREMQRGYNFASKKMFSGTKSDFLEFCLGKCHFFTRRGALEIFQVLQIFSDPPTV